MSNSVISLGKPEAISIPVPYLLAALTCLNVKDEDHPSLHGIHLVERDGFLRIIASDYQRIFLAQVGLEDLESCPSWLKAGITLHGSRLAARLRLIVKDTIEARVSYASGHYRAQVSDTKNIDSYGIDVIPLPYPDLDKYIEGAGFAVEKMDFEPVGLNSKYLKHVSDIAKTLDQFVLEPEEKQKDGIAVRCFSGSPTKPIVFDFSNVPGVLLFIPPVEFKQHLNSSTISMLAPALKATLSALRAHQTRQEIAAQRASNPFAKAEAEAKAESFKLRIAALLAKSGMPQLAGPTPAEVKALAESEAKAEAEALAKAKAEAEAKAKAEAEAKALAEAEALAKAEAEALAKAEAEAKAKAESIAKLKAEAEANKGVKDAIGGVKAAVVTPGKKEARVKTTVKFKAPNATGRN
jgi:hypothetical protein